MQSRYQLSKRKLVHKLISVNMLVLAGDHYSIKMSLQLDHLKKVVHGRHHLDLMTKT